MKTFINYYGGKYRISAMYGPPKYDTIIEPFAGAAGYSLRHSEKNVKLYEVNTDLVAMWKWLISASPEDVLRLPVKFDHTDELDVEHGAKVLIGFCLNTGIVSPAKTRSNWAKEYNETKQFWGIGRRERISQQVTGIKHWECILVGDYSEIPNQEATWFIDPPYQNQGKHYIHNCENINFTHLAEWSKNRDGEVFVCEQEGATWLPWTHSKDVKANAKTLRSKEVWYYQNGEKK
jgi:site-specific DNA-adenine methylase